MKNLSWPNRIYSLDISRAIASIAVIIWHWQHFYYQGYSLSTTFTRSSQPFYGVLKIFYEHGGKGVQYFFLLSGFVFFWIYYEPITTKTVKLKDFFTARFSRLYPLHFLTLIIVLLLQLLYFYLERAYFIYQYNDLQHFILNLFFASQWGFEKGWSFNGPVWSVSIEILLYFIFFLIAFKKAGSFFFCLLVSFVSFTITTLYSNHSIFIGLTSFFLGGVLYTIVKTVTIRFIYLRHVAYLVCLISWGSILINFYIFDLNQEVVNFTLFGKSLTSPFCTYILFPSTIASLTLFELTQHNKKNKISKSIKSWAWVGDITYSSYLLHFPLQLISVILVSFDIFDINFYSKPWYFISFFLIIIPLSYYIFLNFEKPMQNYLRDKNKAFKKIKDYKEVIKNHIYTTNNSNQ